MIFGNCDPCGKNRVLHRTEAYGIETYACDECAGGTLDLDDYLDLEPNYFQRLHDSDKAWLERNR